VACVHTSRVRLQPLTQSPPTARTLGPGWRAVKLARLSHRATYGIGPESAVDKLVPAADRVSAVGAGTTRSENTHDVAMLWVVTHDHSAAWAEGANGCALPVATLSHIASGTTLDVDVICPPRTIIGNLDSSIISYCQS
jgi:hypothetical protein